MKATRQQRRDELLSYLKGLTERELVAYCSGVLSARGAAPAPVLIEVLRLVQRKPDGRLVLDLREPKPRPVAHGPRPCAECGSTIPPHVGRGRPRLRCESCRPAKVRKPELASR